MNKPTTPQAAAQIARFSARWVGRALAVIVLVILGVTLFGHFVNLDDAGHITENGHVAAGSIDGLIRIWSKPYFGLYIPLTYSVWWFAAVVSRELYGAVNPGLFHALSLCTHALNTTLVFHLVRRCTASTGADAPRDVRSLFAPAIGALVFAFHPTQVESVAWVSEFRGLLAACLCLLALHQALEEAPAQTSTRHPWRKPALSTALFVAALLAKPTAIVLPALLLTLNRWGASKTWRSSALLPVAWGVLSLAAVVLTKCLQPDQDITFIPTWAERPLVAVDALGFYLTREFWPWTLGMDYGRSPSEVLDNELYLSTWPGPAALLFVNVAFGRKRPWLVCATLLFVVPLLPVLGIVPFAFQAISTVADRYMYLAHVGTAWAVAFGLRSLPVSVRGVDPRPFVAVAVLALAAKSHVQARYWQNTEAIAQHSLSVQPDSTWMRQALATEYYSHKRYGETLELCSQSVRRARPDLRGRGRSTRAYLPALKCVGSTLIAMGEAQRGANYLARMLQTHGQGRISPQDEAILAEAHQDLGSVLFQMGNQSEGIAHLRRAIELAPELDVTMRNLGRILQSQGDIEGAIHMFRQAIEANPYDQRSQRALDEALAMQH